jgi:hypothetical protein
MKAAFQRVFAATIFFGSEDRLKKHPVIDWSRLFYLRFDGTQVTFDGQQRPNQISNPNGKPCVPGTWFHTCAFVDPPEGSFGNAGRNTLRGPGLQDGDFSIFKNFPINDSWGPEEGGCFQHSLLFVLPTLMRRRLDSPFSVYQGFPHEDEKDDIGCHERECSTSEAYAAIDGKETRSSRYDSGQAKMLNISGNIGPPGKRVEVSASFCGRQYIRRENAVSEGLRRFPEPRASRGHV